MELLQFKDIVSKLEQWSIERKLDMDKQRSGIIGNLLEEITEFSRANNEIEKIDALSDILVFLINVMDKKDIDKYNTCTINIPYVNPLCSLLHLINKYIIFHISIMEMIKSVITIIEQHKYNAYLCLIETIKEISSRTGSWDDNIKKFIKDKGLYKEDIEKMGDGNIVYEDDETIIFNNNGKEVRYKKWYKANYILCSDKYL